MRFQSGVDGASTYQQMAHRTQAFGLLRHLQGGVDLQGNHRSQVYLFIHHNQGMAHGWHFYQAQTTLQAAHHHHLRSDVAQVHAQQSRVPGLQTEEITGHACGGQHAILPHLHALGTARGTAGLHLHRFPGSVPFG